MESFLYHYRALIISVYDGDTVRADIDLGCKVWIRNEPLRLLGIDAPEIRGEERPRGLVSRDFLRELILGKEVFIRTLKDRKGKYGRYLAEIYLEGEDRSVNQIMIDSGMAEDYGG